LALAALAPPAKAFPTSGGGRASCLGCHGTTREAAIPSVLEITARPGDLVPLIINLTNGANAYSASLSGLAAPGLAGFSPDAAWVNHFTSGYNPDLQYGGPFYALSNSGVAYQGPVSHTFNLQLAANTQLGTYPLSFTVAGLENDTVFWRDANPFSLTVVPEPATIVLLTAGAVGSLILWRRSRRRESG
jgi:hypothetical protein